MAHTKLRLVSKLFGMESVIGDVKVEILAHDLWDDNTKLRTRKCPKCGVVKEKMVFNQEYKCVCGESFAHWSAMPEIMAVTGEAITKERLLQPKEQAKGFLYRLTQTEYAKRVSATAQERGLTTADPGSAKNLKKLIVAQQSLGYVIAVKWNDTYEQKVGILTVSEDNTVVLKELIPENLVEINTDVIKATKEGITTEEIEEAKAFLKFLPEATSDTFKVSDYRTQYLKEQPTSNTKVQTLEEILKASKTRAEAAASATTSWRI